METRDKVMIVCAAVIFAVAMVLSWLAGKHSRAMATDGERMRRDTVTVIDTVVYRVPVAKDSTVVRYVTRTVPVAAQSYRARDTASVKNEREVMPLLCASVGFADPAHARQKESELSLLSLNRSVGSDSAAVVLPITQKMYSDTDYRAWVSGYEPQLDSIKVFPRTVTVRETIYKPPSRFSVGVQAGYGLTPKGLQPYIGVGVGVRVF